MFLAMISLRNLVAVALCAMLGASLLYVLPAAAQSQPPLAVGVVDFEGIMNNSKAGKSIKSQFDKQKAAFAADIEKQQKAFKDSEAKLLAQRASMSAEEFQKKAGELNKQGAGIEKTFAQRHDKLEASVGKALQQVRDSLVAIVRDIATARKLTLVVDRRTTVFTTAAYDFTDEAMQKLDAKLQTVKLN